MNRFSQKLLKFSLVLVFSISVGESLFAETYTSEKYKFKETQDADRFRISLDGDMLLIVNGSNSLSGAGLGADLTGALSRKIAMGGAVREMFQAPDTFSPLFTELNLHLDYALTGTMMALKKTFLLNDNEVLKEESSSVGGWRAQLIPFVCKPVFFLGSSLVK